MLQTTASGRPEATCGSDPNGLIGTIGLVISPDGNNVYTASDGSARPDRRVLPRCRDRPAQPADAPHGNSDAHNCLQEQSSEARTSGCGRRGHRHRLDGDPTRRQPRRRRPVRRLLPPPRLSAARAPAAARTSRSSRAEPSTGRLAQLAQLRIAASRTPPTRAASAPETRTAPASADRGLAISPARRPASTSPARSDIAEFSRARP